MSLAAIYVSSVESTLSSWVVMRLSRVALSSTVFLPPSSTLHWCGVLRGNSLTWNMQSGIRDLKNKGSLGTTRLFGINTKTREISWFVNVNNVSFKTITVLNDDRGSNQYYTTFKRSLALISIEVDVDAHCSKFKTYFWPSLDCNTQSGCFDSADVSC